MAVVKSGACGFRQAWVQVPISPTCQPTGLLEVTTEGLSKWSAFCICSPTARASPSKGVSREAPLPLHKPGLLSRHAACPAPSLQTAVLCVLRELRETAAGEPRERERLTVAPAAPSAFRGLLTYNGLTPDFSTLQRFQSLMHSMETWDSESGSFPGLVTGGATPLHRAGWQQ